MSHDDEPIFNMIWLLGATAARTFAVTTTPGGSALNLTGWSPSLIVSRERGGTVLFEANSSNGLTIPTPANGLIVMSMWVPATGFELSRGTYHYRMRLVASPTNVWPLWMGTVQVRAQ